MELNINFCGGITVSTSKCFGCGSSTDETSLKICGQSLCPACEEKILHSDAGKTDYQHWIDSCKKFWEELEPHTSAEQG